MPIKSGVQVEHPDYGAGVVENVLGELTTVNFFGESITVNVNELVQKEEYQSAVVDVPKKQPKEKEKSEFRRAFEAINLGVVPPDPQKLIDLTIGVEHRIEKLADRPMGFKPKGAKEFKRLIPLSEIIAKLVNKGIATKTVWDVFNSLILKFKTELNILLHVSEEELEKVVGAKLAEMIIKNRKGEIEVLPGYDGEYGVPVFSEKDKIIEEVEVKKRQKGLGEFL